MTDVPRSARRLASAAMPTVLVVLVAWCALSVVFAGVHYRCIRYEAADAAPMDALQVLPVYEAAPAGGDVATPV